VLIVNTVKTNSCWWSLADV